MKPLLLHSVHQPHGAFFQELGGSEIVSGYGNPEDEYRALRETVGLLDLSFRGRLCLTGQDRKRFLNGQVTNDVGALAPGQGCYAALVTAKGRIVSDLNVYCLEEEMLLDFEPGLVGRVTERFESFIIADDVQVVDVTEAYGLISLQGPSAGQAIRDMALDMEIPEKPFGFVRRMDDAMGEVYLMNHARTGTAGFDLFVPAAALGALFEKAARAVESAKGRLCGWQALEILRVEADIPRFGADMDESHLAPEAGLEKRAISYAKGCYTGQEVIARIRTYGQLSKALRGLERLGPAGVVPKVGDKLYVGDREVGILTSAVESPAAGTTVALGYVRREFNAPGTELELETGVGRCSMRVVELPVGARS